MKFDSPRLLTVLMRNGAIAPDLIRTAPMKFRMNQRDIGKHAASGMPGNYFRQRDATAR